MQAPPGIRNIGSNIARIRAFEDHKSHAFPFANLVDFLNINSTSFIWSNVSSNVNIFLYSNITMLEVDGGCRSS